MPISGVDFFSQVDRLFNESPEKFADSPESLLDAIRATFTVEQLKSSISLSDSHRVRGGSLVRSRCMIQDTRGPEMFAAVAELEQEDGSTTFATGLFRDSFDYQKFSCRTFGTRHCYVMTAVPGATDWFLDAFKNDENTIQVEEDNDSTLQKRPRLEFFSVDRFVAKFLDASADDLRINRVFDIYGVISEHNLCDDSENSVHETNIINVPNVHVIHYEEVVDEGGTEATHTGQESVSTILRDTLKEALGDALSADFLLMHLVSRTYCRPDGQPMCTMPLNLANVRDAKPLIELIKLLMPKVKVLEITPELLSNGSFVSVKNQETGELKAGELQLSNGTMLIIDEEAFPYAKVPVGGNVEQNLEAFKSLLVDQRLHYDYVFSKVPLDCDIPMMTVSRGQSRFFKTPFVLPLPLGGVNAEALKTKGADWLWKARKALAVTRNTLDKVAISAETATTLKEDFVHVPRRPNEDRAELLNRLLVMCRLLAALSGESAISMEHWRRAKQLDSERLDVLDVWRKELTQN